jgi:acyl carrier protein phosphodiesterase
VNHPQRRLAALATLARQWSRLQRASGKSSVAAAIDFFQTLEHPFWNLHYTLTSEASAKRMALIGESRVAEILANVLFPFWLAQDVDAWAEYVKLPARLSNRRLETAATRLFGNDPRGKQFLKTVAHQQGLLQIYEDFCMQDNSDCAQCPFPEQMVKWT